MNCVLVSNKKTAASFSSVISKTANVNLLAVENVVKNNFISRILDVYNPHAVIFNRDVQIKTGGNIIETLSLLRLRQPNIRIIYIYGQIDDQTAFDVFSEKLINLGIFDIITKPFKEVFPALAEKPWDLQQFLQSLITDDTFVATYQNPADVRNVEPLEKDFNRISVKLDYEASQLTSFDTKEVNTVYEKTAHLPKKFIIGVSELQRHVGCTHLCFEIASYLSNSGKRVCIILSDFETYNNLVKYYAVPETKSGEGIIIQNIAVVPYSLLENVKENFDCIIVDYGSSDEHIEDYANSDVKIKLCDAADWNIALLMSYINNSSEPYVKRTAYVFFPVSQSRFIKYNKQLIKSGCKAYRLQTSIDCLQPCEANKALYAALLKEGG